MNDIPLSQNLADYRKEDRDKIDALIEEARAETKELLKRRPDEPPVLIGGVGFGGDFDAVGQ